jgi:hypothetical protein
MYNLKLLIRIELIFHFVAINVIVTLNSAVQIRYMPLELFTFV